MKLFGQVNRFSVTQTTTTDAHSGASAARVETLGSKGTSALYPKVIAGTLFLGSFKNPIDMDNTLNNTLFGVKEDKKPLLVRGYYKYTPGAEFHRWDPESGDKYNVTTIEPDTKDECAINAILYEISSDDDPYITGVDTYNESKLTAVAKLADGTAKADYTSFSMEMNYLKPYDPTKKYRFAIICASSKYGDTFSGAPGTNTTPGSVLIVDDIEVLFE
jgi:hypothetical protein